MPKIISEFKKILIKFQQDLFISFRYSTTTDRHLQSLEITDISWHGLHHYLLDQSHKINYSEQNRTAKAQLIFFFRDFAKTFSICSKIRNVFFLLKSILFFFFMRLKSILLVKNEVLFSLPLGIYFLIIILFMIRTYSNSTVFNPNKISKNYGSFEKFEARTPKDYQET